MSQILVINPFTYIYIYTHTHTHTHIYTYILLVLFPWRTLNRAIPVLYWNSADKTEQNSDYAWKPKRRQGFLTTTKVICRYILKSLVFMAESKIHVEFFPMHFFFFNRFWLRWVFIAVRGLSLVVASGDYSSLWCTEFSWWWLLLLQSTGSRHASFSSCSTQAQ